MSKVCVLSDIDGVVADPVAPVFQELWSQFGISVSYSDVTQFDMAECLWPHVMHAFHNKAMFKKWMWRAVWSNAQAMEGCQPWWEELQLYHRLRDRLGIDRLDLIYITARPLALRTVTRDWLNWWGLGMGVICCGGAPKEDVYEARIGRRLSDGAEHVVVVEDHIGVAAKVASLFSNDGRVEVVCPERPWTTDFDTRPLADVFEDLMVRL